MGAYTPREFCRAQERVLTELPPLAALPRRSNTLAGTINSSSSSSINDIGDAVSSRLMGGTGASRGYLYGLGHRTGSSSSSPNSSPSPYATGSTGTCAVPPRVSSVVIDAFRVWRCRDGEDGASSGEKSERGLCKGGRRVCTRSGTGDCERGNSLSVGWAPCVGGIGVTGTETAPGTGVAARLEDGANDVFKCLTGSELVRRRCLTSISLSAPPISVCACANETLISTAPNENAGSGHPRGNVSASVCTVNGSALFAGDDCELAAGEGSGVSRPYAWFGGRSTSAEARVRIVLNIRAATFGFKLSAACCS